MKIIRLVAVIALGPWMGFGQPRGGGAQGAVPRTWDDRAVASLELPLPNAPRPQQHVPPEYYYAIPSRDIYKSYPVYHPDREPAGYIGWLSKQAPAVIFDLHALRTEPDWIKAGELVFEAPISFNGSFPRRMCIAGNGRSGSSLHWRRTVQSPLCPTLSANLE